MKKFIKLCSILFVALIGVMSFAGCSKDNSKDLGKKDLEKFEVILNVNEANYGKVYGAGSYYENTEIIIFAEAEEGYLFESWSDGVVDRIRTIKIDENQNLTAIFKEKTIIHTLSDSIKVQFAGTELENIAYVAIQELKICAGFNSDYVYFHFSGPHDAFQLPYVYVPRPGINAGFQDATLYNACANKTQLPSDLSQGLKLGIYISIIVIDKEGYRKPEYEIHDNFVLTVKNYDLENGYPGRIIFNAIEDEAWEDTSFIFDMNVLSTKN